MDFQGKLRSMASIYLLCDDKIWLLHRSSGIAKDTWIASAGGHMEACDQADAKTTALRELSEELTLTEADLTDLTCRYVTLRRTSEELRINYYFFAQLIHRNPLTSNEGELRCFSLEETVDLPMPPTARFVLTHYRTIGRYNRCVYGGIADENTVTFAELPAF